MCLWKLKNHLEYHLQAWSSPVWLDQLINKTQVSYCLCLPSAGTKITWHHTQLCMWAMRIKLWLHADRAPHPSLYVGNRGQTVAPCLQGTTPSSYMSNGDQTVTRCLLSKRFANWVLLTASSVMFLSPYSILGSLGTNFLSLNLQHTTWHKIHRQRANDLHWLNM